MALFHFLWLSNIPLCVRVCVCVCVCVHTHHIFFTYSSIDRYLGCFHDLAIVNIVAMNTGMHASFGHPKDMTRSEISGSYDSFLRNHHTVLFSVVAVLIYIITNSIASFPFLYTLLSIYCL